jgi:putative SOS response-associated peptidase YedK
VITFVQEFCQLAVSVLQNQALDFGRRFDSLFAFAGLWSTWSENPAAKWLSRSFLICEMKYCAEMMRQDQVFVGTPVTRLL